ncbi:Ubiquitin-protein ligase e3 [Lasiodiplodia theobromae]|uniref:Ubiquitin-protein ligase e3 n=1 Tax=Lasiodiplodia theobromae TaxID=45133 RepID=UPI0015C32C00|nr:Ubiquitin-protein ligase e3 [Lasiodiplodia theobromae]KAF4538105.1 Ubiquitin-protein ligase e3 [Lasiodiplodia theobromae]
MEAAIRWSPHAHQQSPHFIIVDVAGNRLRLCEVDNVDKNTVRWKQLAARDKLPNFTAFDWSKTHEHYVAIGSASGEASLLEIDAGRPNSDFTQSFPIKHQRKCNSIAFSTGNLLATGLDRVRNDFCMNIYDLNLGSYTAQQEPYKKLASSEAITSIKFFPGHPQTLVAGVSRQCIRIYDLRDSAPVSAAQYGTRQVHNLAIDPLDENYIISAGPTGDPTVSVWDRRFASRPGPTTPSSEAPAGAVLELRPAVDNTHGAAIWGLRFSGTKRGCFGAISNTGELKVVEIAQFECKDQVPGSSGNSSRYQHFTKYSHTLHYPWYDPVYGQDESTRSMAFDFMAEGSPVGAHSTINLQYNREIKVTKIPTQAPTVRFTALDEIYCDQMAVAEPTPPDGPISEDLERLQVRVIDERRPSQGAFKSNTIGAFPRIEKLSMENFGHKAPDRAKATISRERHEQLLTLGFPDVHMGIGDTLKALGVAKRRAKEGYCLDCKKNKQILSNDPWLVGLWELVQRLDDLAKDGGMIADGVDLSYLGVAYIWENSLGGKQNGYRLIGRPSVSPPDFRNVIREIVQEKEYPPFQGVKTQRPEHRQLCLAICGWTFSAQRIRENCKALIEQGQYYKAIVLAVFKGHKDIALDFLKQLVRQRLLQNIGLGAVIACDTVNKDQRELCEWMAEETEDPYLKALLQYFITGNWEAVTKVEELSLVDRVGVALKYLDDDQLTQFIKLVSHGARVYGDIEGLVFTGLGERAMDLLEQYIAKFGDVQTAVLVMARTNPLYVSDARWDYWTETYFLQLQTWRCFIERTRFIVAHNKVATTRDGACLNKPFPRQITIRCMHCQLALARRGDQLVPLPSSSGEQNNGTAAAAGTQAAIPPTANTTVAAAAAAAAITGKPAKPASKPLNYSGNSPSHNSGLVCPRCGRRMPRCGICMMWLGSPDPATVGGAESLKDEDHEARQMVFCMTS